MKYPAVAGRASTAPRDKQGKVFAVRDWKLSQLIPVAHEVGWIQADARDFATALRDYRNLVHPIAQQRLGHAPDHDTARICWDVVMAALNDLAADH